MQAVRHAGHGGGCDGGALQHCEAVRHKQTLCIGAPGRFEIEVGLRGMCILTVVSSIVSKTLYPSVFTSNFALLINSFSIASSYAEREEQVGTVLFKTIALPACCAN